MRVSGMERGGRLEENWGRVREKAPIPHNLVKPVFKLRG